MILDSQEYGRWFTFWTFQITGWTAYFIFTVLGSIETFQSIEKAVLINGIFSLYGFVNTSGLRTLFNSFLLRDKPIYYLVTVGVFWSLLSCWVIVISINLILISFDGIPYSTVGLERLFDSTFKFLFVFLGWTGLYLGGKFWADLQTEKQKLLQAEASNKEMQLEILRSQLNPHFLFNTINSISALIRIDPEKAESVIDKFSKLLRKSLSTDEFEWITIKEELDLIENYLLIQQIRFNDKIRYSIDLQKEISEIQIPTFLLYPLVENAVKYGIKTSGRPLSIWINADRENGEIKLECINTGKWIATKNDDEGLGIGLKNVQNRLQLAFENRQKFNCYEQDQKVITQIIFKADEQVKTKH